ncbi:putative Serine/threonine-protein kinase ppk18 [Paratrimastix pyriformis]|uniref:non-specific serine/threonine protein kinase n=1 Tax=Paratrimastix pyriformis TaxID=342808 RepID=A0ABQ8U8M0_9EUKA|nr:putative Serine/threonine-protein kinase ppk18 [Paratrimastix pyriformis]
MVQTYGQRVLAVASEKLELLVQTQKSREIASGMGKKDASSPSTVPAQQVTIHDFEIIKHISEGAFGRVYLCRKKKTGDLYAVKVLAKGDMIRKNQVDRVRAEHRILATLKNPFIVDCFFSFQTKDNLYLVMEYLPGGDCYSLLRNVGCLPEQVARMYAAELVLALEYLHRHGIVHRDLKPDNILIGATGHIKLIDFGLSHVGLFDKQNWGVDDWAPPPPSPGQHASASPDSAGIPVAPSSTTSFHTGTPPNPSGFNPASAANITPLSTGTAGTRRGMGREAAYSCVGTPDYLAPEILLGTGHGPAVDWWAMGVILFEFLTGYPPFCGDTKEAIFHNVLHRDIQWPAVPEEMSMTAYTLISRLLATNQKERLGSRLDAAEVKQDPFTHANHLTRTTTASSSTHQTDAAEVKQDPFFAGIEWDKVLFQPAAWIPRPRDGVDTSYFEVRPHAPSGSRSSDRLPPRSLGFVERASAIQQQYPISGPIPHPENPAVGTEQGGTTPKDAGRPPRHPNSRSPTAAAAAAPLVARGTEGPNSQADAAPETARHGADATIIGSLLVAEPGTERHHHPLPFRATNRDAPIGTRGLRSHLTRPGRRRRPLNIGLAPCTRRPANLI